MDTADTSSTRILDPALAETTERPTGEAVVAETESIAEATAESAAETTAGSVPTATPAEGDAACDLKEPALPTL